MTKRIPSFYLAEDYADSVSLWRFGTLVVFFVFLAVLGLAFVHLRFKVRDLKIAINQTEQRIEKLREREKALEAVIQTRAHQWTLKQTAAQQLGMIDFNPQQIIHLEYPNTLLAEYAGVASRYQLDQRRRNEADPIRLMLNRFTPATADAAGGEGAAGAADKTAASDSSIQAALAALARSSFGQ